MTPDQQELLRDEAIGRGLRAQTIAILVLLLGFISVFVGMFFDHFWAALVALLLYTLGLNLGAKYGFAKGLTTRIVVYECEEQEEEE